MQRQSLGSPATKLHVHGFKEEDLDSDDKRRDVEERDSDKKAEKVHRSSHGRDSMIHFIPFIVLVCFLILVLVSHSPSDEELFKLGGLKRFSAPQVDSDFERLLEIKKGNVLAVVSHRSLQEVAGRVRKSQPRYLSRKLGNF
ncbi:uncharacterized protein [Aristolochia californica]|uniref:uncharacterized protein n=1 Tax=Aristolochia californica TaxID=171875 RepID=UPI0035DF4396